MVLISFPDACRMRASRMSCITRSANGATSKRMRSLAFVEGDVTLVNTPFSFTIICSRSAKEISDAYRRIVR